MGERNTRWRWASWDLRAWGGSGGRGLECIGKSVWRWARCSAASESSVSVLTALWGRVGVSGRSTR